MQTLIQNFYSRSYIRWKINKEKAGKDITGEEYEIMRKQFWQTNGFTINKEEIAGFTPDQVIRNSKGQIIVIEEDKSHYVDSCFLDRFIMNAAKVIQYYIDQETNDEDIPYIILSSMTTYSKYETKFSENKKLFLNRIQEIMDKRVKYFPICKHDRVKKGYYKNNKLCFILDEHLIENQKTFVGKLLR